jgi:hypothetical protein
MPARLLTRRELPRVGALLRRLAPALPRRRPGGVASTCLGSLATASASATRPPLGGLGETASETGVRRERPQERGLFRALARAACSGSSLFPVGLHSSAGAYAPAFSY